MISLKLYSRQIKVAFGIRPMTLLALIQLEVAPSVSHVEYSKIVGLLQWSIDVLSAKCVDQVGFYR